ncbi:MAG: hypothetical protein M1827_006150 [Pycnora praestabilis]|nr:MAG: hypothetical protein M1827_006150 [Pycnora praestabilis]
MGDYESGYDPKYGYNRNAFAHKTLPQAIVGKVVKLLVLPIGLTSEAIHHQKDKKRSKSNPDALAAAAGEPSCDEKADSPSDGQGDQPAAAYVNVPADQADELVASGQALPADGETVTHELIPEDDKDDGIECDEADWALDEAASETEEMELDLPQEKDNKEAGVHSVHRTPPARANAVSAKSAPSKLPFPVILPQRRPGTKSRGFVRAYAPVLQDSNIDQEMFLSFLKNFHKAAQASPIFDVVIVATAIMGVYPDIIVGLVLQAVQIATAIGQEVQERWRMNKFLDQANKEIFKPRGLFALVVTYKPGSSEQPEVGTKTVDIGAMAMAKYGNAPAKPGTTDMEGTEQEQGKKTDEMKEKMKQLRIASGKTHGEAELPATCAPLIFPALDVAAAATEKEGSNGSAASGFKAKSKSMSKFVSDYNDRRAQAIYATKNPNSTLTTQVAPMAPQFKSRFANPNNATNTHLFTLLTGGRWKAEPLGARRRYERAQRKAAEKRAQGRKEQSTTRIMQENVLYLMVVNMPTEQELEKARREMQVAKEEKAAKKKAAR